METYVACGECGTTYWTSVPPEAISHIRRCMRCTAPALEVVAAAPFTSAQVVSLPRTAVDDRARERSAKALERAGRARRRASEARLRGHQIAADRHERAAKLHADAAEAHLHLLGVPG